jgi:hypothetical protein
LLASLSKEMHLWRGWNRGASSSVVTSTTMSVVFCVREGEGEREGVDVVR